MCIKSGFNLIHRGTKGIKQLSNNLKAYLTLCCQNSMVYKDQKSKKLGRQQRNGVQTVRIDANSVSMELSAA